MGGTRNRNDVDWGFSMASQAVSPTPPEERPNQLKHRERDEAPLVLIEAAITPYEIERGGNAPVHISISNVGTVPLRHFHANVHRDYGERELFSMNDNLQFRLYGISTHLVGQVKIPLTWSGYVAGDGPRREGQIDLLVRIVLAK